MTANEIILTIALPLVFIAGILAEKYKYSYNHSYQNSSDNSYNANVGEKQ